MFISGATQHCLRCAVCFAFEGNTVHLYNRVSGMYIYVWKYLTMPNLFMIAKSVGSCILSFDFLDNEAENKSN